MHVAFLECIGEQGPPFHPVDFCFLEWIPQLPELLCILPKPPCPLQRVRVCCVWGWGAHSGTPMLTASCLFPLLRPGCSWGSLVLCVSGVFPTEKGLKIRLACDARCGVGQLRCHGNPHNHSPLATVASASCMHSSGGGE